MDRGGVQSAIKAAVADCGIHRKIFHALVAHLLEAGVDLREIQRILGHADPKTTARYTHLTDAMQEKAAGAIETMMQSFQLRWEEMS